MDDLETMARSRIDMAQVENSLTKVAEGNPYAAEPDPDRRLKRLETKENLTLGQARVATSTIDLTDRVNIAAAAAPTARARAKLTKMVGATTTVDAPPAPPIGGPEKAWGSTVDFVSVAFLEKGARIARSVGRIAFPDGRAQGTGFLIGGGLFITNHHVIGTPEEAAQFYVEFDFERDLAGLPRAVTRHSIDTTTFITDPVEGLDFTIVAIGPRVDGPSELAAFGWTELSDAGNKHMLGEFANIVQHPQGRYKEVVLRENRLVARDDVALHYVADTEPGSSGSPVYNSEWQAIALHHWGGPFRLADKDVQVNEGIRISVIVRALRDRLASLDATTQQRVTAALQVAEMSPAPVPERAAGGARTDAPARIDADGRVTWTVPIEISVRLPAGMMPIVAPLVAPVAVAPPLPSPPVPDAGTAPSG